MPDETNVDSFVLRFVREAPMLDAHVADPAWRGVIRHVQSNRERPFLRWEDAQAFISEFIDLRQEHPHD